MDDLAQTHLKEPEQVDWEHYNSGSKYQAPPPALDANGNSIVYHGVVVEAKETDADQGYLNFLLDPIKIVNTGTGFDGQTIRFTRASTRPFEKGGEPIKGNPNKLANFLRAVGLAVKPQSNVEYREAVKRAVNRQFAFTIDWEAYNKDTGETVRGYNNFPDDPERPGKMKSVLKAGDIVTESDAKGNVIRTKEIQSEVLFANARLRYFKDATPKVGR